MWMQYAFGQAAKSAGTFAALAWLRAINASAGARMPKDSDIVVSLTTHGSRLNSVWAAIESIARGTTTVAIWLWLDEDDYHRPWPDTLHRLVQRGLVVRKSSGNYGPHTKYFDAFQQLAGTTTTVITIDDDVIYPKTFVEKLLDAHTPGQVTCYRAHHIVTDGNTLAPYTQWEKAVDTTPAYDKFATGVSGVLYPPEMIQAVAASGKGFLDTCPRADDVWLHAHALRANHKIAQVHPQPRSFNIIPHIQFSGLVMGNTIGGGNDEQIKATYTAADIEKILGERA
ncbi:hypothetical protein [Corynebacterium aquilae]|uniref:Glycosyltransferase n=1 Tax=Corynebacterium aquilae DSM 44791 TaxID=1431546 RepID=A0A1L7CDV7_9CORY|nr:hypothetical protein [Corynebacterium aquilae]APT83963.1 hypothetical protein CAQU_01495 [Corynebacterium aquilae DSM 44791]